MDKKSKMKKHKISWLNIPGYIPQTWNPIPSWGDYEITKEGVVRNKRTGKLLCLHSHANMGHLYFTPKRGKKCYVHCAVLETYVGPRPDGFQCRHLDGNPKNNCLENLSWGSPKENAADRIKHGHVAYGEDAPFATVSNVQASEIRDLSKSMSSRKVASLFGISHTTVQKIVRGERYAKTA